MSQTDKPDSVTIHPTAVVSKKAHLELGVKIGPYCCVGDHVTLKKDVELISHVVVDGRTTIGEATTIFPFASIGLRPQDKKFHGEESYLEIGKNCHIREHATISPGTEGGGLYTRIGDDCLLMISCHVAHDCIVGNHVILSNNATLAGHVSVDDHAILGGLSAVHQFVRIGRHAMIGGASGVEGDVIPFGLALGNRARLAGLNLIGLKRRGFSNESIQSLRSLYGKLFEENDGLTLAKRVEIAAQKFATSLEAQEVIDFILSQSQRPLCQPK